MNKRIPESAGIRITNKSFEEFETDSLFDAVFSATAFHWVDASVKYEKAFDCLKVDGIPALYWNNYSAADEAQNTLIQNVYKELDFAGDRNYRKIQLENIKKKKNEITNNRFFSLAEHRILKEYSAIPAKTI